ncbi:Signal transduction histidine kinase [Streptomyces sp. WMMB 714]|uniref:ATP-binding protein n=1 Tax=Streptomyces sp. WMMB 714 TaxID=1286822 RepID=UPI0005F7CF80|nr:ATP-binding protein [Streptomyces sp. WMMB 714]SCK33182.1 Signal transduction histidine kinase [Streptomyces sp. WMMB 714]
MTPETSPPSKQPRHGATDTGAGRSPKTGTGTALAFLIAVLVTGPACLYAVYASPLSIRPAVAWASGTAAVLLSFSVALATRGILLTRHLRAVVKKKDDEAGAERAVAAHFADVVVPILVERLRSGASAQTALATVPTVANNAYQRVLHLLANEVHRGEGMRAAAMAACANAAGRVQALATSMAADLRELEHKYSDEEVLGDLLHLDHRTAQTGRLADSIAVLTGARTGRRWAKPIVMESILRGAMGRISGYQRVRLHSSCELAVAGHAAEGVMHALAELMDNAANFSPPTSEVHVYVEEASAGVIITVEDGGLVMGDVALQRAQQAVSAESLDLTNLSGTRLGLAVVGRLAHKHNLSVSFRPSAHGGTGVLLMIPQTLITQPKRESQAMTRESGTQPGVQSRRPERTELPSRTEPPRAEPARSPAAERGADIPTPRTGREGALSGLPRRRRPAGEPAVSAAASRPAREPEPSPEHASAGEAPAERAPVEETGGGLPKRRRGQTLAAAQQRTASSDADRAAEPARSAEQSGSRFGAFRRAVQGGSSSPDPKPGDAASPSPSPSSSRPEDHTE